MCQVLLSPLIHNVLLSCVEELGGQSELDSSRGQILCPQMLGTQKGHTQAGRSGQPLPVGGLSGDWLGRQPEWSGGPVEMPGS